MKLQTLLLLGLLSASFSVTAQHIPQAERHRISSGQGGGQQAPESLAPGYWAESYVAVAMGRTASGEFDYVYTPKKTENAPNAEEQALDACNARGWQECRVFFAGSNGWAAIAEDGNGGFHAGIGASKRSARKSVKSSCKKQEIKCKVIYYVDSRPYYKTF